MKLDRDKVVFLLGGQDLEMQTIRDVLVRNKIQFKDADLSWDNAKLSAYKKTIHKKHDKIFYAVELEMDDEALFGEFEIRIIDHHGKKYNERPASLLQVLELLGKKPTRDQKLIAANDARYIGGMECLGATEDKIRAIRQEDRRVQGVTKSDEIAGKNNARSKKVENNIAIVCATTPRFSAITDSLYFDAGEDERQPKAIVYSSEKIVFYGFESDSMEKLSQVYKLSEDDYYFGGGVGGYFGIKSGKFTPEQIQDMISHLVKQEAEEIYSTHIFMFPFRFDYVKKTEETKDKHEYEFYKKDIDARIDLERLFGRLKLAGWTYEEFAIEGEDRHLLYSDFAYFYDYARAALYNNSKHPHKDAISTFFRKEKSRYSGKKYTIEILEKYSHKASRYELKIIDITLRIFQTGVAILSVELDNEEYSDPRDILRINDYGRRVYPQYIYKDGECTTKKSFLASSIQIGEDEPEDFSSFKYRDIEIGNHIMNVLDKDVFTDDKGNANDKFLIQPSLDDRMFVISWYGNSSFAEKLKHDECYKHDDNWYEYIFADNDGATVQNKKMKKQLLKDATYDRWSNYGTLFGITRYSFVCLTARGFIGTEIIANHVRTMYFQMVILLLANRTSVLRFSDEISASVDDFDNNRLEKLYEMYLIYYNRLYFKEVTHQDQGIELYDKGIQQMRISDHVDKLDGKFIKLFEYAELQTQKQIENAEKEKVELEKKRQKLEDRQEAKRQRGLDNLTMLGAVFLPPSLMVALFSMGIFEYDISYFSLPISLVAVLLSGALGYFCAKKMLGGNKADKRTGRTMGLFAVGFTAILMVSLYFMDIGAHLVSADGNSAKCSNTKERGKLKEISATKATLTSEINISQNKGEKDVNSTK